MALDMRLEVTGNGGALDVADIPADIVADLQEAYARLSMLPPNRQITVDFLLPEDAKLFAKQGAAWAKNNGLVFVRKGSVRKAPLRVSFRIYAPRDRAEGGTTPEK